MKATPRFSFCRSLPCSALLGAGLLLAACSTPAPPARQAARPDPDRIAAVAAIRAVDDATSLQVTPLRDAAVDGLLAQAKADEAQRHYDDAFAAIERARKLAPDAPDLIQFAAEIELLRGNTQQAERLAMDSWRKGPKLGVLCERNWQTVIEARKIFNDPAYQATAAAHQAQCKVPPPVRM